MEVLKNKKKGGLLFILILIVCLMSSKAVQAASVTVIPDGRLDIVRKDKTRIVLTTENMESLSIDDSCMKKKWVSSIPMFNGDHSPGWMISFKDANRTSWSGDSVVLKFRNIGSIGNRQLNAQIKVTSVNYHKAVQWGWGLDGNSFGIFAITTTGFLLCPAADNNGVTCEYTLTWADTGQTVNLPFFHGFEDIDGNHTGNGVNAEGYMLLNGYASDEIYVWESSKVNVTSRNGYPYLECGSNQLPTEGDSSWLESGALVVTKSGKFTFRYTSTTNGSTISVYSTHFDTEPPTKEVDSTHNYVLGDTVTYLVKKKIEERFVDILTPYSQIVLEDELPEGTSFVSSVLYHDGVNKTTIYGTQSVSGNKVSYTFNSSTLKDNSLYNGGVLVWKITCKVNNKATGVTKNTGVVNYDGVRLNTNQVSINVVHCITSSADGPGTVSQGASNIQSGSSKTFLFQPNDGCYLADILIDGVSVTHEQLVASLNGYTFSNITANHSIKAIFKENPALTISKEASPDYVSAFGNGEYIFKIEGIGRSGERYEFIKNLHDGQSITMRLPVGEYRVSEVCNQRSQLQEIVPLSNGNDRGETDLELGNASFRFVNRLNEYDNYGHNDILNNKLK